MKKIEVSCLEAFIWWNFVDLVAGARMDENNLGFCQGIHNKWNCYGFL